MSLKVGSLFAGVEGFGQGFEAAGFEVAWQVEIDKDAVSVLERHYPNVRRYRDVRTVDPLELAPVDVVTFGSPCQDLSVAGKRAGFDGERSGLFHEAVRIIGGLRPTPAFCIWENVAGALSSTGGRDFAAALDALADIGALDIVWRVLDAQWWGVPQRRRRIFLVCDFGGERAGQVLLESESGGWDLETSREAGQGSAGDAEDGVGVAGVARSLRTGGYGHGTGSERGDGCDNLIIGPLVSGGTPNGHGTAGINRQAVASGHVIPTLSSSGSGTARTGGQGAEPGFYIPVAFAENQRAELREMGTVGALGNGGGKPGQGYPAVIQGGSQQDQFCSPDGIAPTLAHASNTHGGHYQPKVMAPDMAVRRLTPIECERLMGWPDRWTERRAGGSLIPDGPRYRLIGNGVVAPVAAWIAGRLRAVLEGSAHAPA